MEVKTSKAVMVGVFCLLAMFILHPSIVYLEEVRTDSCSGYQVKQLRCRSCGEIITGKYYAYQDDDGIYCLDCVENKPHCDICGLPTGGIFSILSDGRKSCRECQQTAVTDLETAQGFFEMSRRYLARELDMELDREVVIELVDANKMRSLIRSGSKSKKDKTLGLFQRQSDEFTIYILSGLPLALAVQTMCHEYAHAWQAENYPNVNELIIKEGFAEWVAYKTLVKLGRIKEAKHMVQRKDIYGKGLETFLQKESRGGVNGATGLLSGSRD